MLQIRSTSSASGCRTCSTQPWSIPSSRLTRRTSSLDVVARVRSGIMHANDRGIGAEPMAPFGGVENSRYGKFGGAAGVESFTEHGWVTVQHTGRPTYPF